MKATSFYQKIRKPKIAIFLSILVFFVSCEQYDTDDKIESIVQSKKLDFSLYETYKDYDFQKLKVNTSTSRVPNENLQNIIGQLEANLQVEIGIEDFNLAVNMLEMNANDIFSTGISEGILTAKDFSLFNDFIIDLELSDFNNAIDKFEENIILDENISTLEIEKYTEIANVMKLLNEADSRIFMAAGSTLACISAIAAALYAYYRLFFCSVTSGLTACFLAMIGLIWALYGVQMNCINHQ